MIAFADFQTEIAPSGFGRTKEPGWAPYLEPQRSLLMTLALIGGAMIYSLWHTHATPVAAQ